ncbi:MAG: bifunctional riboflavin kinase/FAD synthetase [Bdellovibrionales bacterium]|nr:bifunctional riboflavin kinase/FAD synthetase [Bdellovibrionales bacterium]
MLHVRGIENLVLTRDHAVLTIGNFDGIHLGHRKILAAVIEESKRTGGPACLYTFRPHPQEVLRPGTTVKLLTHYDEKVRLLESLGLDVVVEEPFSQEFFTLSAREFFEKVIVRGFKAVSLFVGHDFAFGKGREGNLDLLRELCAEKGIRLTVVPPEEFGGEIVSSTRIRAALLAGRVAEAAKLMDRLFFYRGVVVKGDQRGRLLGFPTANLKLENKLALPRGVYATWAIVERGGKREKVPSVTNVGIRPTFAEKAAAEGLLPVVVECHLILPEGETIDLYGETLEVQFVDRFRDEKKFASFDELKTQIALDKEQAREYFRCAEPGEERATRQ